jgi:hypothetical protein
VPWGGHVTAAAISSSHQQQQQQQPLDQQTHNLLILLMLLMLLMLPLPQHTCSCKYGVWCRSNIRHPKLGGTCSALCLFRVWGIGCCCGTLLWQTILGGTRCTFGLFLL